MSNFWIEVLFEENNAIDLIISDTYGPMSVGHICDGPYIRFNRLTVSEKLAQFLKDKKLTRNVFDYR